MTVDEAIDPPTLNEETPPLDAPVAVGGGTGSKMTGSRNSTLITDSMMLNTSSLDPLRRLGMASS